MNREILFEYFITRKNNKENIHLKFILKKNIQLKYLITRVVQDRINIWNNVNNILLHIETNYYYYYKLIFSRKIQKIFLSLIFFFLLNLKILLLRTAAILSSPLSDNDRTACTRAISVLSNSPFFSFFEQCQWSTESLAFISYRDSLYYSICGALLCSIVSTRIHI